MNLGGVGVMNSLPDVMSFEIAFWSNVGSVTGSLDRIRFKHDFWLDRGNSFLRLFL